MAYDETVKKFLHGRQVMLDGLRVLVLGKVDPNVKIGNEDK